MEYWKEFERNPTTHSAAHHLMAIHDLISDMGYARVSDVARLLNISRGSASLTLKSLKHKGLVGEDENRFLHLTAKSRKMVDFIKHTRSTTIRFLTEVLGVTQEQASIDACKIEHLLSKQTMHHLENYLDCLEKHNKTFQCGPQDE